MYKNSQVWCNGYYLGKRPGGYSNIRYDISHCLREGENTIAVKVTHEDFADSRWFTGSGIYRKAFIRFNLPLNENTIDMQPQKRFKHEIVLGILRIIFDWVQYV